MELPISALSTQAAAYEPTGLGRRCSWRARVCLINTQEVELMFLHDLQIPPDGQLPMLMVETHHSLCDCKGEM